MICQVFSAKSHLFNKLSYLIGKNLDLRLIRRICRWDLRDPHCYSNAVVYDITFYARGNLFQNVHFSLQDELKSKFSQKMSERGYWPNNVFQRWRL